MPSALWTPQARKANREVLGLALPIIFANVTVPLLGAVDTAVVGHLDEAYYIGAVAIGALIFSYIYWGFGFLRMGTTGLTAQALGAGKTGEVKAILFRALLLSGGLGLLLVLLQIPIAALAFSLLDASAEVEHYAAAYLDIRIWGAPAALANFALIGWFLGNQNVKATVFLQIWLNLMNIVLDLVFVLGFGWGVEGVAYATLIAEYSTIAVALLLLRREWRTLDPEGRPKQAVGRLLDPERLKELVVVNIDIFIRTLCLLTGFAWFTATGAQQGDLVLAANAVLMNFMTFTAHGLDGFAHAIEALVGRYKGMRDRWGFRGAVVAGTVWAAGVSLVFTLVWFGLGPAVIDLLTGLDEVRAIAKTYLIWVVVMPVISVWAFLLDGIFIGATRTADLRNMMILSLIAGVAAMEMLTDTYGNTGLWIGMVIFMAVRGITLGMRYLALERSIGSSAPAKV
ncbi:MAG: MATE family efflux transporter [Alphaproteobacteria bacterium]|nr:MATE family efflux transporter [Alphaproteobacteria bacterium]